MQNPTIQTQAAEKAPGPAGSLLLGNIPEMQRKGPIQFYLDAWREHGDLVRFQMGPMTMHMIVRPEHIQHVLVKNTQNYQKGASLDKLRIALGNGLFTSEGPLWQRQRRLMAPTYTPRSVTRFGEIMTGKTGEMLSGWLSEKTSRVPLDINHEMTRLAMNIISQSMFGLDLSHDFAQVGKALHTILDFAAGRTVSLIDPPLFLPTPTNRRLKAALRTLDDFIYRIITEKRSMPEEDNLLWLLMNARDEETGEVMDEKQLRDEILITFFAGHETTALLLTWTWFLLSQHSQVEAKLHAELEAVLGGRTPTLEDIPQLVYTRQVIDEALRLYSPVAITARDVAEDDEIDGFKIPGGSLVMIAPYLTHRHPEFWARPLDFNPDHFSPEQVENRPRYAYFPFGAGPRICIGMHFALLEAVLVVSEVAQRARLRLLPGQHIEPLFMGTLRPCEAIMMVAERRS